METFVSRKRRRVSTPPERGHGALHDHNQGTPLAADDDSTDVKLAILASLYPGIDQSDLLDILISSDGSVEKACQAISPQVSSDLPIHKRHASGTGIQSSLSSYATNNSLTSPTKGLKPLTKKGKTLHLYAPVDIANHTPCTLIHNFLPSDVATALLKELLYESPTFPRQSFKLFDRTVQSPHSACFYVSSLEESNRQKTEYLYNGSFLKDVRELTSELRKVMPVVQEAVNREVEKRIRDFYPDGQKLKYQTPQEWVPNAAFVNCYDGGQESVGYHSDQLTYLGPRAVIGSISLGVAREFRVRKVVARDGDTDGDEEGSDANGASPKKKLTSKDRGSVADQQGQISIHLPHNSLLIMHAEMQEEWKHSIAPAQNISPHPIAGNKRINITYRWYRESFHPKHTPRCRCGVATVLRCVQRKGKTRGRYMWMCHVGYTPEGGSGCGFFQWAEFDDDGDPPWTWAKSKEGHENDDVKDKEIGSDKLDENL
jgi:alkylated DNA repair dioxygenase AlkB